MPGNPARRLRYHAFPWRERYPYFKSDLRRQQTGSAGSAAFHPFLQNADFEILFFRFQIVF